MINLLFTIFIYDIPRPSELGGQTRHLRLPIIFSHVKVIKVDDERFGWKMSFQHLIFCKVHGASPLTPLSAFIVSLVNLGSKMGQPHIK